MDCGIPFCHQGCPLGNIIPDWNDLVYRDHWRDAIERLHATNNFPEFTGRLCPAPCEGSCVLGINDDPVTIKAVEVSIIERAFDDGLGGAASRRRCARARRSPWWAPGPAGLAAAEQLNRAGHWVTVFERADRIGGLLRYGIPEFKMEKRFLDRRLALMEKEGVVVPDQRRRRRRAARGRPAARVRRDRARLRRRRPARPAGARPRARAASTSRWSTSPLQNRRCEGDAVPDERFISAQGKHVVIIGGGDTGADCLGTVHRQGAASVHQFELLPRPPDQRARRQPVAAVAQRLPRVVGPRGGRRARLRGVDPALHRRRRRPACASSTP